MLCKTFASESKMCRNTLMVGNHPAATVVVAKAIPCIFLRWCVAKINDPPGGANDHPRDTCPTDKKVEGLKRKGPVANHIAFAGVLYLCQHGLTFAKPSSGMESTRQRVVWTAALRLIDFLEPPNQHIVKNQRPRLAKRRKKTKKREGGHHTMAVRS